ncbi:MAG: PRC-barrel domain-containing protein [Candidatus Thorarchaeota archaeon]
MVRSFCCNEIMNMDVLDSKGKKIGHVGEVSFTFNKMLKISRFTIEGPVWTKFLESLHIKDNQHRVFASSIIGKIDKHIHLTVAAEDFPSLEDKTTIPDDELRFSDLERLDIMDMNGIKVGHAIDVDIGTDGCASLIAGGGFFEEKLESIGLKNDVDIIIPCDAITSFDDTIRLSVPKDELDTTMDGILKEKKLEIQKQREAASAHNRNDRVKVNPIRRSYTV